MHFMEPRIEFCAWMSVPYSVGCCGTCVHQYSRSGCCAGVLHVCMCLQVSQLCANGSRVTSHATRRLPPEVAAVLRLCRWAACVGWHAAHSPSSQHDAPPHFGVSTYLLTKRYDLAQVEVVTPEEHMGDVIGDLNSRRGMVGEFIDKPANMKLIKVCPPPPCTAAAAQSLLLFGARRPPAVL